jgi:anaerobic selenocysteine-containing dehydrogenase
MTEGRLARRLARHVGGQAFDALPAAVVAKTKRVVLHDLAVPFGGHRTEQGERALAFARSDAGSGGRATIIGHAGGAHPNHRRLEFFAQAELFHTPTSRFADVLLPAASFLESEALYVGPSGTVQRRPRVVEPLHERRPDIEIIFDLAGRLGLADRFGGGDPATAFDEVLSPLGLSWEELSAHPFGVQAAPPTRYAKYAEHGPDGHPEGFATPSRKVELFSDTFAAHGFSPLPEYEEPAESPVRTPHLTREFPLVLTNAKRPQYLHGQHRGIAAILRTMPHPTAELHPDTAARHGVRDGDWIVIETPRGRAPEGRRDRVDRARRGLRQPWLVGRVRSAGPAAAGPVRRARRQPQPAGPQRPARPDQRGIPHRSSLCRVAPVGPRDA